MAKDSLTKIPDEWINPKEDSLDLLRSHVNTFRYRPSSNFSIKQQPTIHKAFYDRFVALKERRESESSLLLKPLEENLGKVDDFNMECKSICRTTLIVSFIAYFLLRNDVSISPNPESTQLGIFGFSLNGLTTQNIHFGVLIYLSFQYLRIAWSRVKRELVMRKEDVSDISNVLEKEKWDYDYLESGIMELEGFKIEDHRSVAQNISFQVADFTNLIKQTRKRIDAWEIAIPFLFLHFFSFSVLVAYQRTYYDYELSNLQFWLWLVFPYLIMVTNVVAIFKFSINSIVEIFGPESRK